MDSSAETGKLTRRKRMKSKLVLSGTMRRRRTFLVPTGLADRRGGKAKRAHLGPFQVGTLRFSHPTDRLHGIDLLKPHGLRAHHAHPPRHDQPRHGEGSEKGGDDTDPERHGEAANRPGADEE